MKELTKVQIKEFVEMTGKEMKHVVGGAPGTTTTSGTSCNPSNCSGDCNNSRGTCTKDAEIGGIIFSCACVVK